MRPAIAILLLVPALAFGQAKDDKPDKVSNDDPARPLQMPPASTETKEALEDFERFQRRGRWERALEVALHDPRRPGDSGSSTASTASSSRSRGGGGRSSRRLPPAGQAACRLFYDAEAKKLLDEAEGASELKNLERVYSAYFITSVGDNAADRLGDLYFELGRFDRAADCWLSVLRERPDTDLAPALLAVKAAVALGAGGASVRARAGPRRAGGSLPRRQGDRRGPDRAGRPDAPPPARRGRERPPRPPGRVRRDAGPAGAGPRPRGRPGLAVPHRRLDRGRHDADRAQPVAIQRPEHRRAGRRRRGAEPLRQLPRPHPGAGPGERQAALAHRVVPQPRAAGHAADRPDARPQPVRDRGRGRARLDPGARRQGPELRWPRSS